MSEPFVGQVIAVGFNFAPVGWAMCDGSLLPISENAPLFSLIGTAFGGNGTTTFALPDLRGRAALGFGQGAGLQSYSLAQVGGVESPGPGVVLGAPAAGTSIYATAGTSATLSVAAVSPSAGGGQPHENRQPSTTVNYIISLSGIFPSQA